MSFFKGYLKERWKRLLMLLLFVCIFAFSFWVYRLPVRAVIYPCALCLLFGAVFAAYDIAKAYRRHKFFEELHRRNTELISALPEPEGIVDSDYQQLISVLKEKIAEITAQADSRIRDTVDYYTVWAHQIKTPIAAMRLTLQKEDVPEARRLASELSRIEQYVEMVLVFVRLGSDYSDYVFTQQDIDEIIRSSVKKFASEFIDRRIRLEYDSVDIQAVTDEKWFAFVIEQLLSNALKYTREGSIKIYSEGKVLCIKDTGIGIAPEDLPRVFDKGYTGMQRQNRPPCERARALSLPPHMSKPRY